MNDITLENVRALNAELVALGEIGIPSDLAHSTSPGELSDGLKQINSSLALRCSLGQSLLAATTGNHDLPPTYRSALEAGLRSNRLSATLDGISHQATADDQLRTTCGRSFVGPLIVSILGYIGFLMLCLNFLPTLLSLYEQFGEVPGGAANRLVVLRNWLPYWATVFPLTILATTYLWLRGRWGRRFWRRLIPGARKYASSVRNAQFARQLRLLLENGLPLAVSLPVAAAVTGDDQLIAASATLSEANANNEKLADPADSLSDLPPLLRWALTGDLGNQSLPEILQFVEKTYRHTAERRAAAWRVVLPATISAVLGGLVVLAYGWSLFGPYVQLLQDIAL